MDIYAKKIGESNPQVINPKNTLNMGERPLFMSECDVDELNSFGQGDNQCWEWGIINQIKENKYDWFDFSKSIIDIGAGVGEYSILTDFEHAYAFEPEKSKQCLIYANMFSHDRVDNVTVLPYAVSDTPGVRPFSGWSEDLENKGRDSNIHNMEYRTLDSFNFENVSLIKADIEGFEYHAIKSGIGTIIRNDFPALLIEMWTPEQLNVFFDEPERVVYMERHQFLQAMLTGLGYVMITNPTFGDWETKFFIHQKHLNGYGQES